MRQPTGPSWKRSGSRRNRKGKGLSGRPRSRNPFTRRPKHLAKQLGPYGITANCVVPGTTLTPRVRKVRDAASIERIAAMNPMRHLVEPEDCAEAVLFLASDRSAKTTGCTITVDGGVKDAFPR